MSSAYVPSIELEIIFPIPVVDLAAGRHPDLLSRLDMGQRTVEVLAAVGMANQKRMEADRHDAAGLGAVFIKYVELVADHPAEHCRVLALVEEHWNVVELDGIGHRQHR